MLCVPQTFQKQNQTTMEYYPEPEPEYVEEVMPYYEDDEDDGGYIEVNEDDYWDVYFTE